jgi:uncharacterized protein
MNEQYFAQVATELKLGPSQIQATARLLAEGATGPFIARYRKEATGALDEVAISAIRDRLVQIADLDQRREAIFKSLAERSLLTDELKSALNAAQTLTALEDLYLPYRPKRRTRAAMAREKGLEPLADILFNNQSQANPVHEAHAFVSQEKGLASADEALAGARDIPG